MSCSCPCTHSCSLYHTCYHKSNRIDHNSVQSMYWNNFLNNLKSNLYTPNYRHHKYRHHKCRHSYLSRRSLEYRFLVLQYFGNQSCSFLDSHFDMFPYSRFGMIPDSRFYNFLDKHIGMYRCK